MFRVVDATTANQIGDSFTTDGKGHALSDEVPVDAPLRLEDGRLGRPAGIPVGPAREVVLTGALHVEVVTNTVSPTSAH